VIIKHWLKLINLINLFLIIVSNFNLNLIVATKKTWKNSNDRILDLVNLKNWTSKKMAIKISLDWKFNVQDFGIEIFFMRQPYTTELFDSMMVSTGFLGPWVFRLIVI